MRESQATILSLEEAGAGAIDAVMRIMQASFDPEYGEAWNRSQCLGMLAMPGVWMAIASVAREPAGFALNRLVVDEAELLLIAVRPDFRGRGVGSGLIRFMIEGAERRGAAHVHLEVREGNDAIRLYSRAGFTPVGRRHDYYRGLSGNHYDALTLRRAL